METGTITLTVESGPRRGASVGCVTGGRLQVGRVLKGNDFTIKDRSISEKHFAIEFDPVALRWTVIDLDSSNGTSVNATVLTPNVPFPVQDGDLIKMGEVSTLSVRVSGVRTRGGRGRRRKKVEENEALEIPEIGALKIEALEEEKGKDDGPKKAVRETRLRGRGKKAEGNETAQMPEIRSVKMEALEEENGKGEELKKAVGGRRGKKVEASEMVGMLEIGGKKIESLAEMGKDEKAIEAVRATRFRGRGKKLEANATLEIPEMALEIECLADDKGKDVDTKKAVGGTRRGRSKKKSVPTEQSEAGMMKNEVGGVAGEEKKAEEKRLHTNVFAIDATATATKVDGDDPARNASAAGPSNGKNVETEADEGIDIENMTVAQWLDSLEKYLPMMISDVADECIAKLNQKARLYEENLLKMMKK